jgi:KEOPS complex subunit Cgi121
MLDFPDEDVALQGLRGPLKLEDVLFQAKKSARIAPLQVVRADRVVGADHVRSAATHATRAIAQGRAHGKSLETEFARYLAGERQVRAALDKVGLPDEGAREAVVVAFGPHRRDAVRHFADALGLEEDDALCAASEAKLLDFGITATQLAATTPGRRLDLVLEAVAAVDLMRS